MQSFCCIPVAHQNELIAVIYLENDKMSETYTRERVSAIDVLSAQAATSLRNAMLHEESLHQMAVSKELEAAEMVQKGLLPNKLEVENLIIGSFYKAAESAGGDWYYYHHDRGKNILYGLVGDVTGHGISSAMVTGVIYGVVNSFFNDLDSLENLTPSEVIKKLSHQCDAVISEAGRRTDKWMTMLVVALDLESGEGWLVNSGHQNAILIRSDKVVSIRSQGHVLGRYDNRDNRVVGFKLQPGEQVMLFTDGLLENKNRTGREISAFNLRKIIEQSRGNPQSLCESLVGEGGAIEAVGPQDDDTTILVIEWGAKNAA